MKVLYYECFSGISGDMNLGALVDIGVPIDYLQRELSKLGLSDYRLEFCRDIRKGISGTKANVIIKESHTQHSHIEHLHHRHDDSHSHANHEHHEECSDRHHNKNYHEHRSYSDITQIIAKSGLSQNVKEIAQKIFYIIAQAEAKIHSKPIETVHFHEVGAIDSIIDIVGAAICIDYLKPDAIYSSVVEVGGGKIQCAHGLYPVPAPATAEILSGIPIHIGGMEVEATTPTGAAILKATVTKFSQNLDFTIQKTGYGIGSRDNPTPNVLRVYFGETSDQKSLDYTESKDFMIECNIDDMNPEFFDYIIDGCFNLGANDVFLASILMKKNRNAQKLSVLAKESTKTAICDFILLQTSSYGLRITTIEKLELKRNIEDFESPYGKVRIKTAIIHNEPLKIKVEYEDLKKIALQTKKPIGVLRDEIMATYREQKNGQNRGQ